MRFGCGSDVVRMWSGCGSEMGRRWVGGVCGSGADSLAEVKGKWLPAARNTSEPYWDKEIPLTVAVESKSILIPKN